MATENLVNAGFVVDGRCATTPSRAKVRRLLKLQSTFSMSIEGMVIWN